MPGLGLGISPAFNKGPASLDASAEAWLNKSATPLSGNFKQAADWFFRDLKSGVNWSRLDVAIWGACPDKTLALTFMNNPNRVATEQVSSGWIANEGFMGNGLRYLDTDWDAATDGVNFTRDNGSFMIFTGRGQFYEDKLLFGARGASGVAVTTLYFNTSQTRVAVNDDLKLGTFSKTSGTNGGKRVNSTQVQAWFDGVINGTIASVSDALTTHDFLLLGWNANGTPSDFSSNKIIAAFWGGDLDMLALRNSIYGFVARLNGGYQMTAKNYNISGMPRMDSSLIAPISPTELAIMGGYSPEDADPSNGTDRWWISTDSGVTWPEQSVMPYKTAHLLGGLRNDGYFWAFGQNIANSKLFCIKLDPVTKTWTTVNADLTAVGQSLNGLEYLQWGGIHNNELYWALTNDGGATVKIYKTPNGNDWSFVSNFPAPYANNSGFWFGDRVIVGGGCKYVEGVGTSDYVDKIYESTDHLVTWQELYTLPTELQGAWPNIFVLNNEIFYVAGRKTPTILYDGTIYKWNGTAFQDTLMPFLSGRHAVASCGFNGKIYFANGFLNNDCYELSKVV